MLTNKKSIGFTLIELLVVIAIFVLIANITMISLNKAKMESRDVKRVSDINQLRSALHLYSTENLSYPQGTDFALGTDNHLVLGSDVGDWTTTTVAPVFMYNVPRDPSMINALTSSTCTPTSDSVCDYSYTLNGNDFINYFFLEGGVGNLDAGLHFTTKDEIH